MGLSYDSHARDASLLEVLKESRARLGETSDALLKQTRETAARADEYVRENPWTGVGIGAAVGLVLGVLLTRR